MIYNTYKFDNIFNEKNSFLNLAMSIKGKMSGMRHSLKMCLRQKNKRKPLDSLAEPF
jgi:hypothetical protein